MKPPALAPAALGGSIVTGAAAMTIGLYQAIDCIQFRTGPGQCDAVIQRQALPVIAGAAALLGAWGGFNTLNTDLDRDSAPDDRPRDAHGRFVKRRPEDDQA